MVGYNELYELLRKEKYSENLQPLPKKFIEEFRDYIEENKESPDTEKNFFSEAVTKSKKQLENAISIFRELMLKRKRKILNLVFVATETGIMKRDYENMLPIEKEIFDKLIKIYEEEDKEIERTLSGKKEKKADKKMVVFKEDIDQFVDQTGNYIGPYKSGEFANISADIADILVQGGKAGFVDEN
jgi:DNA replication initiation complex subunit (GINS family)